LNEKPKPVLKETVLQGVRKTPTTSAYINTQQKALTTHINNRKLFKTACINEEYSKLYT